MLAVCGLLSGPIAAPALAQTFNIPTGTTDTTPNTLSDGQSGTIENGGALSIASGGTAAITWNTGSIVITNAGLIQQAGTGRGINTTGATTSRNITFTNSGSLIAADDAFRVGVNVSSGTIHIENTGIIRSSTGQGIDLASVTAGTALIEIFNRSGALIEALNQDGVRPGQNGLVDNAGTIRGTNPGVPDRSGVRGDTATNFTVINRSGGLIEGAHHGIDQNNDGVAGNPASSTLTVTNYAGGTIRGNNGSGIGSDGYGTVTNYGTITGAYVGSGDGDGDGVDIDFIGTVTNYGIIEGTGAGGVDSGGNANDSEGIAMGGGSIINGQGGLISGATRSILIDNGSGGSAYGAVTIENAGTIQGLAGPAITIVGAYTNSITNSGLIKGAGALPVIGTGVGDDTLVNSGTIDGSIDLGGGANSISNLAGGLLKTGPALKVGSGNTVTNSGTLSPGGSDSIVTTTLTGNLTQTSTGTLAIDLNLASHTADRIDVTGTADVNGRVTLSMTALAIASGEVTILSAGGGATPTGLSVDSRPAFQATLVYPNANDVVVSYALSFAPTGIGLNENQASLGNNLNAVVTADPASLSGVTTALLALTSGGEYTSALDQLSPEIYGDTAVSTLYGARMFGNALLSCHPRQGAYVAVDEEQCLWADVSGRDYQQDRTAAGIGYDERTWSVSGGGQVSVAKNVVLGFAGGFEQGSADTSSGASADTDRVYGGVALKHTSGPWLLAAAVYGGKGWADTSRPVNFGGLAMLAEGEQDIEHLSGRVRAAYQAGGNAFYLKPLVDLEATQLWLGSVHETGGPAALSVDSSEETIFSAAPALEIGGATALAGGILVRPFARVGAIFYSNDSIAISSSFAGGPAGIPAFQTQAEIDRVMGTVAAGLDLVWSDSSTLKLHYDGMFGEDTEQHAFGAKASVRF